MAANSRPEKAGRSGGLGTRNVATALGYGWVLRGGGIPTSVCSHLLPFSYWCFPLAESKQKLEGKEGSPLMQPREVSPSRGTEQGEKSWRIPSTTTYKEEGT